MPTRFRLGGAFALTGLVFLLSACATPQVRGTQDFSSSDHFIIPAEIHDPVGVGRIIIDTLEAEGFRASRRYAGARASAPDAPESAQPGFGSGFFVSRSGHLLTNAHVVQGAESVYVVINGTLELESRILKVDSSNDLAVLQVDHEPEHWLRLTNRIQSGDAVRVIGYPLTQILGDEPRVTDGVISSTTGVAGDPTRFQITAAIHSGNSGGPVLDADGAVVGVATEKLSDAYLAEKTGEIPQNINFAVKSTYAIPLLPEDARSERSGLSHAMDSDLQQAIRATALVRTGESTTAATSEPDASKGQGFVVLFRYYTDAFGRRLMRLEIEIVNPQTGEIITDGSWSSSMSETPSRVTRRLVEEMIGVPAREVTPR